MNRLFRSFSTGIRRFNKPLKDSNGLYYGKFTQEEYDEAAQQIRKQIDNLETNIKGDTNIRENLDKMPSFPLATKQKPRIDNLTNLFEETIKTTGPLSLSAYMRQCLTHEKFGYYTTRNPLDANTGDFITSPEISSVFGEMIGIYFFQIWINQKFPSHIKFIEFGPGKGTLIYDALKNFNKLVDKFSQTKYRAANNISIPEIHLELIEASRVLRLEQHKLLCGENEFKSNDSASDDKSNTSISKWGNTVRWVDTETEIDNSNPDVANFVIAHEFFDALPIKSFENTKNGWRELLVEHTPSVNNSQQALPENEQTSSRAVDETLETEFHLTLSPKESPSSLIPTLSKRFKDLPEGTRIEICPDAELYMQKLNQLINNEKGIGAALVIDYGVVDEIPDNSLRGIYKHKFVSPFYKPGEVDLSINVDFDNLAILSAPHNKVLGPVDQGDWLHELGVGHRVDQLLKLNNENPELQDTIYNAYVRLTAKDDKSMGKIYKFMGLVPKGSEVPLGFQKLM